MRRAGRTIAGLLAVFATPAAADESSSFTIRVGQTLEIAVNGVAGRLRVDPAAVPTMMCNPDFAARAKIVAQGRAALLSDPDDVFGSYGMVSLRLAGRTQDVQVNWLDRSYVAGADCVASPEMIGTDVVRFALGPAVKGERTVALPLNPGGAASIDWNGAVATAVPVGKRDLSVGFTLIQPGNSVTASGALRIANTHGGRYAGDAIQTISVSGRERQLRRMVLASPLAVGPLAVREMQVRMTDWGTARRIKTLSAKEAAPDPDEITVVAREQEHNTYERLTLGSDQLKRCSSLVVDRRAREVRLTCG